MEKGKNIDDLFKVFLSEQEGTHRRSKETLRGYQGAFSILKKLCPDISLQSLSQDSMNEFFIALQNRKRFVGSGNTIEKSGVKDSTVHTYARKLFVFFRWLVLKNELAENPLKHVKLAYPSYTDVKALNKNAVDKIRGAIESNGLDNLLKLKRDRMIVAILLFCGLRRG